MTEPPANRPALQQHHNLRLTMNLTPKTETGGGRTPKGDGRPKTRMGSNCERFEEKGGHRPSDGTPPPPNRPGHLEEGARGDSRSRAGGMARRLRIRRGHSIRRRTPSREMPEEPPHGSTLEGPDGAEGDEVVREEPYSRTIQTEPPRHPGNGAQNQETPGVRCGETRRRRETGDQLQQTAR